jgi:glutathione S-transferase
MPVLRDEARNRMIPESSVIIEYLQRFYPGPTAFVPDDAEQALHVRLRDRFFDLYLADPMQKIVTDKLRPLGQNDPAGVARAMALIETAYGLIDKEMATKSWACRLRRGAAAVLCGQTSAVSGPLSVSRCVFRSTVAAALLCAGVARGRALLEALSGLMPRRAWRPLEKSD